MSHPIPAVQACIEALRMLEGLPPYDGGENVVRGDSYFAQSIERDHPKEVFWAAKKVVNRDKAVWELHRKAFIKARS